MGNQRGRRGESKIGVEPLRELEIGEREGRLDGDVRALAVPAQAPDEILEAPLENRRDGDQEDHAVEQAEVVQSAESVEARLKALRLAEA